MAPASENDTAHIDTRVPDEVKARYDAVSEYDQVTISSLVRPLIMRKYRELEDHPAVSDDSS